MAHFLLLPLFAPKCDSKALALCCLPSSAPPPPLGPFLTGRPPVALGSASDPRNLHQNDLRFYSYGWNQTFWSQGSGICIFTSGPDASSVPEEVKATEPGCPLLPLHCSVLPTIAPSPWKWPESILPHVPSPHPVHPHLLFQDQKHKTDASSLCALTIPILFD